jgi:hypothetical protein
LNPSNILQPSRKYNFTPSKRIHKRHNDYAKKRAREAEIGRELTTEEFLADHYEASDAPTASGTSIFDPVLCEIAYRWFCPQGGTVLDPFAGGRASRVFPTCATRDVQIGSSRSELAREIWTAWISGFSA